MSALTDEQRQKINENRQKAIEKRKAALAALSSHQNGPATTTNIRPVQQPVIRPTVSVFSGQVQPRFPVSSNIAPSTNQHVQPQQQGTSQPLRLPQNIVPVTGTCTLVSKDRFVTEMPYQRQAIEIFKSINGAQYGNHNCSCCSEPQSRRWTFPITEHNNLIKAMESLKPNVVLGQLPLYILHIFRDEKGKVKDSKDGDEKDKDTDLTTIDPVLRRALFPFQREGILFGLERKGRVIIADDMGLGKTIQALGIAHYYKNDWPLLIVTPSSMRYTWRESIWQWLPSVNSGSVSVIESTHDDLVSPKVLIMSYDLLQRRAQEPSLQKCGVIIMDESHHLKNYKTSRSKAAIPLLKSCKRAILLSGTPALSRPIELYNQISALKPMGAFPNYSEFGIRYCNGKKLSYGWDMSGSSHMSELQLLLEKTVMIRRLKSDVLQQLPDKRRKLVILDPGLVKSSTKALKEKAKAYQACAKSKSHGSLLEYYNETGQAKLQAVQNYIKELIEDDQKFLCFAHHQVMLHGICEILDKIGCKYVKIDGSTKSEERKFAVDRFQFSDDVRVAVLSITAANTGITLTAASLVVFAELYWNPGILIQAEDRVHRIGQSSDVMVQYLVAKKTADDDLWAMLNDKLDVLTEAGLSKENFRETDFDQQQPQATADKGTQQQMMIDDFFQPIMMEEFSQPM